MAKMIIRHLEEQGQKRLLNQLAFYKKQHKKLSVSALGGGFSS
jgi:hypothetical protein